MRQTPIQAVATAAIANCEEQREEKPGHSEKLKTSSNTERMSFL